MAGLTLSFPLAVSFLLCLLLNGGQAQEPRALFPATDSDSARSVPVAASATCRVGYTSSEREYGCSAACPFGSSGASANSGLLAVIAQPECACAADGGNITAPDLCCRERSPCTPRLDAEARPVQYVNDASAVTFWQSTPEGGATDQYTVNVTLDLLIQQEILRLDVEFEGLVPQAMILLRSQDGTNFEAYEYFAVNCESIFGLESNPTLTSPEQVLCTTEQSSARRTSVTFQTLTSARLAAAGTDYANSNELQAFTRARYLRFHLTRFHTLASARDDFGQITTQVPPLYRVRDVTLLSRCACNGHGESCAADPTADDGSLACACQHDTAGRNCERCAPLYNRKAWRRGISNDKPNVCLACNCNSHAESCHYEASLDTMRSSATLGDGGVCDDCMHSTTGRFCEQCIESHYRNSAVPISDPNTCLPCGCNVAGVVGSGRNCDLVTGACTCKTNVEGRDCGTCKSGYYGLDKNNEDGCQLCVCNALGTDPAGRTCNGTDGQCDCLASNMGRDCSQCSFGHYRPLSGVVGQCRACHPECNGCHGEGPEECTACKHVSDSGVCRPECPAGEHDQNGFCLPCHSSCLGNCSAVGNSVAACNGQCKRYAHNGFCVDACPLGTYIDADFVCRDCASTCSQCYGPGPAKCDMCKAARDNGVCVTACPAGKYEDSNGNCQQCHISCDGSLSCSGPGAGQCEACAAVFDTVAGVCRSECPPQGFYETTESGRRLCRMCSPLCASTCDGPDASDCIGSCIGVRYEGACVAACPALTFEVESSTCRPCDAGCNQEEGCFGPGPHQCFSCAEDSFTVLSNNLTRINCVGACPAGMYADERRQCHPCHAECEQCFGPSSTQCTHCRVFAYYPAEGFPQCLSRCPVALAYETDISALPTFEPTTAEPSSGDCSSSDCEDEEDDGPLGPNPLRRQALTAPYGCLPCHPECSSAGCSGSADTDCMECQNVEYKGQCLPACPPMTFRNEDDQCIACSEQCAGGCSGAGPDACDACRTLRFGDTCVAVCPANTFNTSGECFACSAQCSASQPGCSGPSPFDCVLCASVQVAATGQCVPECPRNMYADADNQCQPCHALCDGCTGPATDQCLGCRGVVFDHFCLEECPTGFFRGTDATCVQCDFECAEDCTGPGPTQCTLASDSTRTNPCRNVIEGTRCLAACTVSTHFLDVSQALCVPCSDTCDNAGCTAPGGRACRGGCAKALLGDECVLDCPLTHYLDSEGVCRVCDAHCTAAAGVRRCHGAGPAKCTACVQAQDGATCVATCKATQVLVDGLCRDCHPQCMGGCRGTAADQCAACALWEYDGVCMGECPSHLTYANRGTLQCEPCHPECNTREGAGGCPTGTAATDCRRCARVKEEGACRSSCSLGRYADATDTSEADLGACRLCHPECSGGCTGPSAAQCNTCARFNYRGTCVDTCPALTFRSGGFCLDCNANCLTGCTGAGAEECTPDRLRLETNAKTLGCRVAVEILPNAVTICHAVCPVGLYANPDGICTRCEAVCPLQYGCSGPGAAGCNSCPSTQYLDVDRQCQDCNAACREGCDGPSEAECHACRGARFGTDCVASCVSLDDPARQLYFYGDADVTPGETVCRPCHPQCAPGGCSGKGPTACLGGCAAFSDYSATANATGNPTCVAACNANSYTSNSPVSNACHRCAPECSGGCTGPGAASCVACAVGRDRRTGVCVSACAENEVLSATRECECPSDRAYVSADGSCQLCSFECQAGCFGPGPDACSALPSGCRVAELDGECVAACPSGMEVRDKECVCKTNFYPLPGGVACAACSEQCLDGCSGPRASQCNSCRAFRSGTVCVAACGPGEQPDSNRQCTACSSECAAGCFAPSDARQCGSCRNYVDDGTCVQTCPSTKPFARRTVCLATCPSTAPYYNDTRAAVTGPLTMPQECVSACEELGIAGKTYVSDANPLRCMTAARAARDAPASSSSSNNEANVIAGSVAGAALGIVFLVVLVLLVQRRSERKQTLELQGYTPGDGRLKTNPVYLPAQRAPGGPNGRTSRTNPYILDASPDGGYMDVHRGAYPLQAFDEPATTMEDEDGDLDYAMNSVQSTHI